MSEATSDYPLPRPAAPPRRARAVPRPLRADRDPPEDPRLAAALSLHDPVFPLDPPLEDVRIPVKEPHAAATAYSRAALRHRFPGAEVGDDLHMLFSEPGREGQSRLSPDVLVALDVPRRGTRGDYDADVLGPPDFILEVLSRSTWRHDLERKLRCYQSIGVRECMFFDVTGEDRSRTGKELWGCALTPQREEPLEVVALPNGERGVRSEVLGLVAYVAERTPPSAPKETWALTMRWHDPATGEDIPDYAQSRAETQAERTRREAAQNEARAERAGREAAQREAHTERAARQAAQREAHTERTRRQAAQREARTERDARQAAQREAQAAQRRIAELEEELARSRRPRNEP